MSPFVILFARPEGFRVRWMVDPYQAVTPLGAIFRCELLRESGYLSRVLLDIDEFLVYIYGD